LTILVRVAKRTHGAIKVTIVSQTKDSN